MPQLIAQTSAGVLVLGGREFACANPGPELHGRYERMQAQTASVAGGQGGSARESVAAAASSRRTQRVKRTVNTKDERRGMFAVRECVRRQAYAQFDATPSAELWQLRARRQWTDQVH
jgi:hypothetical protein